MNKLLREDLLFMESMTKDMPDDFRKQVMKVYRDLYAEKGNRAANLMLHDLPRIESKHKLDLYRRYALECWLYIRFYSIDSGAEYCRKKGITPPSFSHKQTDPKHPESVEVATAKLTDPEWWERAYALKRKRDAESAKYKSGCIYKEGEVYASDEAVANYKAAQERQAAWVAETSLLSSDGEEIGMEDALRSGVSNPLVRFTEYVTRVKGMEQLADDAPVNQAIIDELPEKLTRGTGGDYHDYEQLAVFNDQSGFVKVAFTLTAPSRFHRFSKRGGRYDFNPKYDKSTPRDAQQWMAETWKLTQTAWKRKTKYITPVQAFGYRVLESHHDGVPHYHFALFIQADDVHRAVEIFMNKALRGDMTDRALIGSENPRYCVHGEAQDAHEAGALKRRLNVKIMTTSGGMTNYMMKYISKGITGADFEDWQSGMASDAALVRLMANRNLWGFRQFAFYNSPSVQVWRELRRFGDKEQADETLEAARKAADAGDWKAYTQAQGGALMPSRQRPILIHYSNKHVADDDSGEPVPALTKYGAYVRVIEGLIIDGEKEVPTRLKDWWLLNMGSLKALLQQKMLRASGMRADEVPASFDADIQSVIDQAKAQNKLHRFAERVGIQFTPSRSVAPRTCGDNFPQDKPSPGEALKTHSQGVAVA